MPPSTSGETLVQPRRGAPISRGRPSTSLPADLLGQAASRLRVLALLYASVFFLAGLFPALLFEHDRAMFLSRATMWAPGVLSIAMALVVAWIARSPRVPLSVVMTVGLVFEVVSSYGIAAAEFLDSMGVDMTNRMQGLSW